MILINIFLIMIIVIFLVKHELTWLFALTGLVLRSLDPEHFVAFYHVQLTTFSIIP